MDKKLISQERDGSAKLPDSLPMLKVTLQYMEEIETASIEKRRQHLLQAFREIEKAVEPGAVHLHPATLSPFAQTIEAAIVKDKYAATVKKLSKLNVRVDPIVLRKLV